MVFGVLFLVGYIIPTARKLQGELLPCLSELLTDEWQGCRCIDGGLVQSDGIACPKLRTGCMG